MAKIKERRITMKKYVVGFIIGVLLAISGQAMADSINKSDSIIVLEANEINLKPNSKANPDLSIGSIYSTDVNGTKYLSILGPDKVQISCGEIWMNGPVVVNDWKDVSNGTKDLQSELDELWKAIHALESR